MNNNKKELGLLQGVGVGFRDVHSAYVLQKKVDVAWFEVLIDNYLDKGGKVYHDLLALAESYPLSFHSVGMSLGSTDPLNWQYLLALKKLVDELKPQQLSDHLCWTSHGGHYSHELLPLTYTWKTVRQVARRIDEIQQFLGYELLLENVSSYLTYSESEMNEWEFYCEVVNLADCAMLIDVNNIYVSAFNHGFNADDYLNYLPPDKVKEIHLAGYEDHDDYLLDSHSSKIHAPVWTLYSKAIQRFGQIPTLIEWDNEIPDFSVLLAEAKKAHALLNRMKTDVA